MGALERLPENALSEELRRRASDDRELKGSFQPIGSRGVVTHRIFSSAIYDVQFTPSSTAGTLIVHRCDVEFVPSDKTFGGAFCYRLNVRSLDRFNNPVDFLMKLNVQRRRTSDGTQKWTIYHISQGNVFDTLRLKFFFSATGSGTFTANVIT